MSQLLAGFESTWVTTGDVALYAVEAGDRSKPSILFLHGYPDDHRVWSEQMQALADDYHIISFDLRGMGKSYAPDLVKDYRINDIMHDIAHIIRYFKGEQGQVHLVGHDWGSILGWSFVSHPEYKKQVLSYTSLSGPHLGMVNALNMKLLSSFELSNVAKIFKQLLKSWYIFYFHIPKLPDFMLKKQAATMVTRTLSTNGVAVNDAYLTEQNPELVVKTAMNGINLYRCNFISPPKEPEKQSIEQPILLLVAERDNFVGEGLFDNLGDYTQNVTRHYLDAKHWAQRQQPQQTTTLIREFISSQA